MELPQNYKDINQSMQKTQPNSSSTVIEKDSNDAIFNNELLYYSAANDQQTANRGISF